MERFKVDTIGALFERTNDYYITISLTDNYCLYIEGLNEEYVSLVNNFKIENIKHLMIELNDYNGNICITIQNYAELQGVGLETTINDLKEKVFDLTKIKSLHYRRTIPISSSELSTEELMLVKNDAERTFSQALNDIPLGSLII